MSQEATPVLFGPRDGKTLKKLYPEIDANNLFKGISNDDILFAWYIGIPNSPVDHDWPEVARYKAAAQKSFPKNEEKKRKYGSMDLPTEIKLAIEEFRKKSPEARFIAKNMIHTIFQKYQELVNVDVKTAFLVKKKIGKGEDAEEIEEMDWTGRKQYVDSTATIRKELPGLLKDIEEGFGISENKKDEIKNGTKPLGLYHANL